MNLSEVCEELGISYNSVRKYIRLGLIHAIKMGKSYRVSEEEIERIKREGIDLSKRNDIPYINGEYNPNYGDNRICVCGHTYGRHFDSFDDMEACGCKYCGCDEFKEREENKSV